MNLKNFSFKTPRLWVCVTFFEFFSGYYRRLIPGWTAPLGRQLCPSVWLHFWVPSFLCITALCHLWGIWKKAKNRLDMDLFCQCDLPVYWSPIALLCDSYPRLRSLQVLQLHSYHQRFLFWSKHKSGKWCVIKSSLNLFKHVEACSKASSKSGSWGFKEKSWTRSILFVHVWIQWIWKWEKFEDFCADQTLDLEVNVWYCLPCEWKQTIVVDKNVMKKYKKSILRKYIQKKIQNVCEARQCECEKKRCILCNSLNKNYCEKCWLVYNLIWGSILRN